MSSIDRITVYLMVSLCILHPAAAVTGGIIGCPAMRNGDALSTIGLFAGPPSEKVELMPQDGRFVVPRISQREWRKNGPFHLICTYGDRQNIVTVVLPRFIQNCDFLDGGSIACH